ncbi:hypothetical protein AVEN_57859-1 [Araneus ventricosus]|uniref:Paired domain-containing protein n=1 Tax=Araneus ventricosus TaxID=182803 RepID=A0A4Y2HNY6_ARAVE|nr:hypothetical protein AVEN_57859-1 [Araneus ventricosus]
MTQRKHLDDFLRGRIIGRVKCGRTQLEVSEELGIAQSVISRLWQRFQDDGNVSRCYSTGRSRVTTPNEDRYLAVTAKRNRRSTASDLSGQLSSATGTTVYMLVGLSDVFHLPQLTVACDYPGVESMHCGHRNSGLVRCFTTSPGLVCSLILAGLSYGGRQVPVTTKRTPLNDTVTVVQDGSFGQELFLVPELTCMFRV